MKRRENFLFLKQRSFWVIAILLLVISSFAIFMNLNLASRNEAIRIRSEGQLRLINITSGVENSLKDAENLVENYAAQLEILMDENQISDELLYAFVDRQDVFLHQKADGSYFSSYVAYNDRLYIRDFIPDESFRLTERVWYVGARKHRGDIYISDPYIDANTGRMCYSVSKQLSDGETIVGLDFTMEDIQNTIETMKEEVNGVALIVNESGMILGHSNSDYVGLNSETLPDYRDVVNKAYNLYGEYFEYTSEKNEKYVIFSDKTGYGWYLIVCIQADSMNSKVNQGALVINITMIVLFLVSLLVYIFNFRRKLDAERRLKASESTMERVTEELKSPISTILQQSKIVENVKASQTEIVREMQQSARELSRKLENLTSIREIKEDVYEEKGEHVDKTLKHKRYAVYIVLVLCLAMGISIGVNTFTQMREINAQMQIEEDKYYAKLQSWIDTNVTLTHDLALHLGAQPDLYKDYEKAVKYIDDVVKDKEDIAVAYIVNPAWEHVVIMNNGWESDDPDWHVEERDWYVDTVLSADGFNISTPYQDEQTGMYCVTFSQIVYDENRSIVGLIGVDFYMDALIDILGESYSREGYAFLMDPSYIILNHPNTAYQMSPEASVCAADTEYRDAIAKEKLTVFKDYDGKSKLALVKREDGSGFAVMTVRDAWIIYRVLIVTDALLLLIFILSIFLILLITRGMTVYQDRMNAKLKRAVDEAVAAGKAKTDFLANMSHEIRTPINAVLGMNEMILRESDDETVLGYSRDIHSAGRTLLSIINDILDFSKIESGKMEIVEATYDVSSMINDLINIISDRAKKKNLELKLDIDENLPETLYGDDVRIRQIITNILTNAVKYTETGSVTLTIRLESENVVQDKNIKLYVAVADTGQGIKEEDIEKLFSSFTRINERKNRTIEGTGLGVNIVSSLLELMHSKIEVNSVYGKGSVFFFTLEQKVVSTKRIGNLQKHIADTAKAETEVSEVQRIAPSATVLIVDDTAMNLRVEANLLKRTEVQVELASSGKKALEMIREKKYDLIFLDHMMPEMDGVETIKEARKEDILQGTPVVVLTANAIAGARQTYLDYGFDNYLSKPVEGKQMEEMLFSYLDPAKVSSVVKTKEKRKARSREKKTVEE